MNSRLTVPGTMARSTREEPAAATEAGGNAEPLAAEPLPVGMLAACRGTLGRLTLAGAAFGPLTPGLPEVALLSLARLSRGVLALGVGVLELSAERLAAEPAARAELVLALLTAALTELGPGAPLPAGAFRGEPPAREPL